MLNLRQVRIEMEPLLHYGVVKIGSQVSILVGNIRCGGNDLRFGFDVVEWNSLGGDTIVLLSGDEDR